MGNTFNFSAPVTSPTFTALNGNLAANGAEISGSFVLPSPVADGGTFYLRWLDWNDNGTTDHQLAIDNVGVQGVAVPEPGTIAILGMGVVGLLGRRRCIV